MTNLTRAILQTYPLLKQDSANVVLATIIETMGSTYQKAGARMLIRPDGEFDGLLAGGCFEADLREQAASVFKDGQAKVVFYDMRAPEDAVWGLGLGCNGAVRVFLQLLKPDNHFHPLDLLVEAIHAGKTGVFATIYASAHPDFPIGQSTFLEATKNDQDQYSITSPHEIFITQAQQVLLQNKPQITEHKINGYPAQVFYDVIKPAPRLLIIGAGPDVVPVTHMARQLGWHITVVDHRPANIKPERFPETDQLFHVTPAELSRKVALDQLAALVLMTHSIEYDERYLQVIANSPVPYIGLLGPAKRRQRLLDSIGALADQIKGRVFGPVGLDIGAETPDEIALSIMAEIQAVLHQRDGARLYQVDLPLHDRGTPN